MATKVKLIGRHAPKGMPNDIEVTEQLNATFPLKKAECVKVIRELLLGLAKDEYLLFQAVPGVATIAIAELAAEASYCNLATPKIGVIVSVPGERRANISKTFNLDGVDPASGAAWLDQTQVESAIKFANGRAMVAFPTRCDVTITVDPIPEFQFSHIEWLDKSPESDER